MLVSLVLFQNIFKNFCFVGNLIDTGFPHETEIPGFDQIIITRMF